MPLYAGFDCSTQGMSVVVIEPPDKVVLRHSFDFDSELPEFGTVHGVLPSHSPGVVHAPPQMWAAALARSLEQIAGRIDRGRLRAISGSAQQHGSVYCGDRVDHLTRRTAPVWMDSSTARECLEVEEALGGPSRVAQVTGSRAFPRFTGPQVRKFSREEPEAYASTRRIHLVSSYLASVLIGDHAPIDHADGSGMNLMDLCTRDWSAAALDATAPGLALKLPRLVTSHTLVGVLNEPWRKRFDLPAVRIVAWSGDNPCSLVGTGLVREGQLALSLGTSDTIFGPISEPRVSSDGIGHVFASPAGAYMGITVFRNGSLARERVRDQFGLDWRGFSDALRTTEPGNGGAMMLPWFEPEITPAVPRSLVTADRSRRCPGSPSRTRDRRSADDRDGAALRVDGYHAADDIRDRRRVCQPRDPAGDGRRFQRRGLPVRFNRFSSPGRSLACVPRGHMSGMGRGHRRIRRAVERAASHTNRVTRQALPGPRGKLSGIRDSGAHVHRRAREGRRQPGQLNKWTS